MLVNRVWDYFALLVITISGVDTALVSYILSVYYITVSLHLL